VKGGYPRGAYPLPDGGFREAAPPVRRTRAAREAAHRLHLFKIFSRLRAAGEPTISLRCGWWLVA